MLDRLREAVTPGAGAESTLREKAAEAGYGPDEIERRVREQRTTNREIESLERANRAAQSAGLATPEVRLKQGLGDADAWRARQNERWQNRSDELGRTYNLDNKDEYNSQGRQLEAENDRQRRANETTYQAMRKAALEDYYRTAFNLDEEQLRRRLRTASEAYREDMKHIKDAQQAGVLTPGTAGRARNEARDEELRRLGIRDPEAEFRKHVGELMQASQAGEVTNDQAARRYYELRQSAAGEMTRDIPELHPMAALEAGSAAAHSMIAQATMGDPKLVAQLAANDKLDAIATRLDAIIRQGGDVGDVLGE
jgi:hypothetical protein